jgi:hypothetical protein
VEKVKETIRNVIVLLLLVFVVAGLQGASPIVSAVAVSIVVGLVGVMVAFPHLRHKRNTEPEIIDGLAETLTSFLRSPEPMAVLAGNANTLPSIVATVKAYVKKVPSIFLSSISVFVDVETSPTDVGEFWGALVTAMQAEARRQGKGLLDANGVAVSSWLADTLLETQGEKIVIALGRAECLEERPAVKELIKERSSCNKVRIILITANETATTEWIASLH